MPDNNNFVDLCVITWQITTNSYREILDVRTWEKRHELLESYPW